MPDRFAKRTKIEIMIETPEGVRLSITAASDSEAEALKAKALSQGAQILGEEMRAAR